MNWYMLSAYDCAQNLAATVDILVNISLNPSQCLSSKEMLNKYFLMRQIHSIKTHLEQEGMGIEVTASGSSWKWKQPWRSIPLSSGITLPPSFCLFCWQFAFGLASTLWWEKGCPPSACPVEVLLCCFLSVKVGQKDVRVKTLNFLCRECRFNPWSRN